MAWTEVEPIDETALAPIFSGISPGVGMVTIGSSATISGAGFTSNGVTVTSISIGDCAATINSRSNTQIVVSYPASCENAGAKTVKVNYTDQYGFTYSDTTLGFTFYNAPTMNGCSNSSVSPTSGLHLGGTEVTLNCGLTNPGKVTSIQLTSTYGAVTATDLKCATTTNATPTSANCSSLDGTINKVVFTTPDYAYAATEDRLVDISVSFADAAGNAQTPKVFAGAFTYLRTYASMNLSSNAISLEITPSSGYSYDADSATISGETNYPGGFSVSLHGNSTSLICVEKGEEIATMTGFGALPVGRWGYGLGASDPTGANAWREIPAQGSAATVLTQGSANVGNPASERVWVGFAANMTQAVCEYEGSLTLTLISGAGVAE
jgi:hypothetical protein